MTNPSEPHAPARSARTAMVRARAERARAALPFAGRLLLVAAGYFAAGKLGLSLASIHPNASAIWPGTGIALGALLVLGLRAWPAIFAGALLVNLTTAGSLASSLGIATGNTLEAVVGAWLVARFAGGRNALDRAGDIFRFAGLVAVASVVSATFGELSLALAGPIPIERSGAIWLTWWLADLAGGLILAPFLLVWSRKPRVVRPWRHTREAVALFACVGLVGWIVFHLMNPLVLGISLKFLCVPPLIWAAFRFGQRTVTAAILLFATLAAWGTLGRLGFSEPWQLNLSLLVVQVFLSATAVTTLALAAVVADRQRAARAEQATSERLREAILQLETFSHAISHDLRSPVGTVLNCVVLLEEDHGERIGEDGVRMLRRIRTAAESATRLLDRLALFAWTGPRHLDRAVVDMTALAREAYAEVEGVMHEGSAVRFELSDLPPAVGSPALLVRVFRNLLSNAVRSTRGREQRRIEVSGIAGTTENTYFVSDNGTGFDPAEREALFEPFHRPRGARDPEGPGVGLAVVARIVRRHGGRVWAESDGSTGARFAFTLRNDGSGT